MAYNHPLLVWNLETSGIHVYEFIPQNRAMWEPMILQYCTFTLHGHY